MIIHPTNENVAVKEYLSSEFDVVQNIYNDLEMLREIGTKTVVYQNIIDALPMLTSLDTSNIDAVAVKLGMLTNIKDNLSMLTNVEGNVTNITTVSNMQASIDSIIGLQGLLSTIASQITNGVFKGDAGKSLIPKGSVQHVVDLPADNISRANQVYSVLDTGDMYIYNDLGVKLNYGNMRGVQGIQGEQGIQGIKGDNGTDGLKGDTGGKGDKGDNGSKGDTPVLDKVSDTSYDLTKIQKTFQFTTTNESVGWTIGSYLKLYNSSSNYALGIVTDVTNSYVVLDIIDVIGSGIYNLWYIGLAGNTGAKGDKGDQGLQGLKGDKGDIPSHAWTGTQLKFQLPDGSWGNLIDLKGTTGNIGNTGDSAWTPVFSIIADGTRQVVKIIDWTGGTGIKPAINVYISSTGYTTTIANAVSIRGDQGIQGIKGDTGNTGNTGSTGATGNSATVTLGTISTGVVGSSVVITNVGTTSAAVLNFTIPVGATGATGAGVPSGGSVGNLLVNSAPGVGAWSTMVSSAYVNLQSETAVDMGMLGGLFDRNYLTYADLKSSVTVTTTSGSVAGTSALFDAVAGSYCSLTKGAEDSPTLTITVDMLSIVDLYNRALYMPFVAFRSSIWGYFKSVSVQVSPNGTNWYAPATGWSTTALQSSPTLPYWFGEEASPDATNYYWRFVRFTLTDPVWWGGTTIYLSQIGIRHVNAPFLNQYIKVNGDSIYGDLLGKAQATINYNLSSSGSLALGLASTTETLDVNGSTRLRGALKDNLNLSGSSGDVLYNVSGLPVWSRLKTVNSTSLLGSGDIAVQPTLVSGTNIKTVNSVSLLGSGNIPITSGLVSNLTCAMPLKSADNQGAPTYHAMVQSTPNTLGGSVDASGYWIVPTTGVYDIYVEGRPDIRNEGGIYGVFEYNVYNHTTSAMLLSGDKNWTTNDSIGLWNKVVGIGISLTAGHKIKLGMNMYLNGAAGGYVGAHTINIRFISR